MYNCSKTSFAIEDSEEAHGQSSTNSKYSAFTLIELLIYVLLFRKINPDESEYPEGLADVKPAWNMSKSDRIVVCGMLLLSCCFLVGAGVVYIIGVHTGLGSAGQVINVQSAKVIGNYEDFKGQSRCPYTLVEFGDYECPPCHEANAELKPMLARYKSSLKFEFRNYPLTAIHPYAMRAALIAETAREQGRFWQVHDALYAEPDICSTSLDRIELMNNLDLKKVHRSYRPTAQQAIELDMSCAASIGINSTPSFILCLPSGQVVRLRSLQDLPTYISHS